LIKLLAGLLDNKHADSADSEDRVSWKGEKDRLGDSNQVSQFKHCRFKI